ncbi:MAG: Aspartate carbamoyltransferase catalytic chain [Chlamydiae bacterium]|nr:Aspartate carbamoyltransferase catalytic chain [Chlamydiota bacterium]
MIRRDIVSIKDLTKEEILSVLVRAKEIKTTPPGPILKGTIMASCFFEPSTRTRLSFESAMKRLGGEVIGFSDGQSTSAKKGESLYDTMKVIGELADCIVLRHPLEGAARQAAEATDTPVINGGDGANEHPTQTLCDLFTIQECQRKLEGLNIALVGDLKFGRTVHSLVLALAHFNCRLFFVSPASLAMPDGLLESLRSQGVPFSFHGSLEEVIDRADILYMTRIQTERLSDSLEQEKSFVLTPALLQKGKESLKVLHPLPRVDEIAREVDKMPQAHYFTQAKNGLYVRQALLTMVLGS